MIETKKSDPKYPKGVYFCLICEVFERYAYYGVLAVLTFFLRDRYRTTDSVARLILHAFNCLSYLTPMIGSVLSDSLLGPYKVVLYAYLTYVVGMIATAVGSIKSASSAADDLIKSVGVFGLFLVAVASGMRKPCAVALAANQFPDTMAREQQRFFSHFYVAINVGMVVSQGVTPGLRAGIGCFGDNTCYPMVFGVATLAVIFTTLLFCSTTPYLTRHFSKSSVVVNVVRCLLYATSQKLKGAKTAPVRDWLDYARGKFDERFVEEVRRVVQIGVLFIPAIIFWALYDQMFSTWMIQTDLMDGRIGDLNILPDQLAVSFAVVVVLIIPLLDTVVYPLLNKCSLLSKPLQKMGLGLFLTAFSYLLAAFVQFKIDSSASGRFTEELRYLHVNFSNVTLNNLSLYRDLDDFVDTYPLVEHTDNITSSRTGSNSVYPKNVSYLNGKLSNASGIIYSNRNAQNHDFDRIRFDQGSNIQNESERHSLGTRLTILWQDGSIDSADFKTTKIITGYQIVYPIVHPRLRHEFKEIFIQFDYPDGFSSVHTQIDATTPKAFLSDTVESFTIKLPVLGGNVFLVKLKLCQTYKDCEMYQIGELVGYNGAAFALIIDRDKSLRIIAIQEGHVVHLLWQLPQYIVMALAEATFAISGMEFAYSQASPLMKSVLQGLFLFTCMFGNLLAMFASGLNIFGHLLTEFFVYASLMLMFTAFFVWTAVNYEYRSDDDCGLEANPKTLPRDISMEIKDSKC